MHNKAILKIYSLIFLLRNEKFVTLLWENIWDWLWDNQAQITVYMCIDLTVQVGCNWSSCFCTSIKFRDLKIDTLEVVEGGPGVRDDCILLYIGSVIFNLYLAARRIHTFFQTPVAYLLGSSDRKTPMHRTPPTWGQDWCKYHYAVLC